MGFLIFSIDKTGQFRMHHKNMKCEVHFGPCTQMGTLLLVIETTASVIKD